MCGIVSVALRSAGTNRSTTIKSDQTRSKCRIHGARRGAEHEHLHAVDRPDSGRKRARARRASREANRPRCFQRVTAGFERRGARSPAPRLRLRRMAATPPDIRRTYERRVSRLKMVSGPEPSHDFSVRVPRRQLPRHGELQRFPATPRTRRVLAEQRRLMLEARRRRRETRYAASSSMCAPPTSPRCPQSTTGGAEGRSQAACPKSGSAALGRQVVVADHRRCHAALAAHPEPVDLPTLCPASRRLDGRRSRASLRVEA